MVLLWSRKSYGSKDRKILISLLMMFSKKESWLQESI